MELSPFESFAFKYFERTGKRYARNHPEYRKWLKKAHIRKLPAAYAAKVFMTMFITFLCLFIFGYMFIFGMYPALTANMEGWLIEYVVPFIFYLAPFIIPLIIYYFMLISNPKSAANKRKRDIDVHLPYAVNFLAAMAATNAMPEDLFRSLARQKEIYGDICDEANWIYRDTKILGMDIIKSLKNAIKRSPSKKLQDFLQGVVNSLTSGRPLKTYLANIANKYMQESRKEQEKFLETLGFLAESYVVVGVAFPIFFMVILVIMYWVSGSGMQVTDAMLYAVVFGGLPIINGAYIFIVFIITPEV